MLSGDFPTETRPAKTRLVLPVRRIVTIGLAVLVSLTAVAVVKMLPAGARGRAVAAEPAPRPAASGPAVVVAATEIRRGQTLEPKLLKIVHFPAGAAPTGAFADIAQLVGTAPNTRVALRAMVPDEPVLAERVSQPGGRANLSGALTPGLRAIGVKSSNVAGVGGFLLPGDRVDVLATRGTQEKTTIQVLAENVRVLGVDQSDDQNADKPHVAEAVTIEVTPQEAQTITLAQAVGAVTLSLRQFGDEAPLARRSLAATDPIVAPSARSAPRRAPAALAAADPAPETAQVRVTRGVETAQYTVGR